MNKTFQKWREGLARTSRSTFKQIASFLGTSEISDKNWEDLEALLIQADIGVKTSSSIINSMRKRVQQEGISKNVEFSQALRDELLSRLDIPPIINLDQKPSIILIVGVNGSGKTTTIAKLGFKFTKEGKAVLLGAADTFRAAAVDQLEIWADRLNLPVVSGQRGGDAAAVAYDAINAGIARNMDVVIIDTAGRLHTRYNLMEELKKVYRVIGKAQPGAPHAVWLVMDATTGQNALNQARAFKSAVNVTGIILAKLDSSSRGGMAFAIQEELALPILFAGLGEKPDDLQPFDPEAFLNGILTEKI